MYSGVPSETERVSMLSPRSPSAVTAKRANNSFESSGYDDAASSTPGTPQSHAIVASSRPACDCQAFVHLQRSATKSALRRASSSPAPRRSSPPRTMPAIEPRCALGCATRCNPLQTPSHRARRCMRAMAAFSRRRRLTLQSSGTSVLSCASALRSRLRIRPAASHGTA
jgi:hypothetical protein